jgi:hypothetical protein
LLKGTGFIEIERKRAFDEIVATAVLATLSLQYVILCQMLSSNVAVVA